MTKPSSIFPTILTLLISIITPFVIIFTIVRLLMTPVLLEVEYRLPGFPVDSYGFNMADRLKWSKISLDYLLSNNDISFFNQYRLSESQPLYNARELSHMDDVKHLVSRGRILWLALLVLFTGMLLFCYIAHYESALLKGLRAAGWAIIGLIIIILSAVFINFDELFTQFHHLFFTGDTWLFYYSDTFIRLFPIRFWMDAFIYICVLSLLVAYLIIRVTNQGLKRSG
jgi:integral membrane protein (TIGR01906 family)